MGKKKSIFNIEFWNSWKSKCKKNSLCKFNLKRSKAINIKGKTVKILEVSIGENLHNIWVGKGFLNKT